MKNSKFQESNNCLIWLEQEEEDRASNPSYLAAAQQSSFRIPPRKLAEPTSAAPPRGFTEPSFDIFFQPAPSPPAQATAPKPSERADDPSLLWGMEAQDQDSGRFGDSWNGPSSADPAAGADPQDSPNGAAEDSQDDLLTLLGIGAPSTKSTSPQKLKYKPGNVSRAPSDLPDQSVFHRTGSNASSTETASSQPENMSKAMLCAICNDRPAKYICLPCRHWGPCTHCVPQARDKEALYPECLRCREPFSCLVRVYKH